MFYPFQRINFQFCCSKKRWGSENQTDLDFQLMLDISIFPSFLFLASILLYAYITVSLSFNLLMDIWVVSVLGYYLKKLL